MVREDSGREEKKTLMMRVKNEKKSAQGTMAQKTSTQTEQLWRQFNRVNHDKMDSL